MRQWPIGHDACFANVLFVTRVLIVRGHLVTPWELVPWEMLPGDFEVRYLRTASNGFDDSTLNLEPVPVSALRDRLPRNRIGEVVTGLLRDRYLSNADEAFAWADVVHAEELSFWFAADAARRKTDNRYRLVQTVWETLPFLEAYRSRGAGAFRRSVLDQTDLFLAMTERARIALLLEGVPDDRILVSYPGIDVDRFRSIEDVAPPDTHVILSPGRLVWEKGHHDVIRALALLHRDIVTGPNGECFRPMLRIIGSGPERARLEAHAAELGVGAHVEFGSVPYSDMPVLFHEASCLVLGSLSMASGGFHPFDVPRVFWEEQFGMVFAEAMAAGLDIISTTSGAIPEVLAGVGTVVPPGDYLGIAEALARGPLVRPPAQRVPYPPELIDRYSIRAASERLAAAYGQLAS
jgi:glycosyltransferase involved in cell wall biosynthesis